jgi:hypothetical protein
MAISIRDGLERCRRGIIGALAFTSIVAFGVAILSAAIWTFDARSLPGYARAWLIFFFVIGFITGAPAFFFRKSVSGHLFHVTAAGAAGLLSGLSLLLATSYGNSCSAIGWHYDQRADLMFPTWVWTDTWNCRRIGRYQEFTGVWTYGEWGQTFKPSVAQASLPEGGLYLDEAGMNMVFDTLLRQRPSRYIGAKIYIRFRGNSTMQGRHDAAHPNPTYWVRDVSEAHFIRDLENVR